MDYDDNDLQNQNFHLVGEENNRFPQSLRSFSLPKFDIDDNLQIQLRFDSLAETEALLGMQGQDNNWLEEFSARHSAINFSSNAGESCSISMHNNVWSEATSSESVEMLLKSVGEDDMLNHNVINKDSDTLVMDDSTDCRMGTDMKNDPTLAHNKCQDVDVIGMQQCDGYTSRNLKGAPESEADLSLLDVKTDSSGKADATPHIDDVKIRPSSDVIKECLNDPEFLELVQNDDPSGNASVINNTFDNSGYTAKGDTIMSTGSLDCSSAQDDPSGVFTSDTNTVTNSTIKESFSEQRVVSHHGMNLSMKPELLHPDNELNVGNNVYSVKGTVSDQHFEVHNADSDACKTIISSSLEPLTDSLGLLNKRHSDSVFSQNSEGLLESIAYQVKLMNKDSMSVNKAVSCSKESASVAILRDGSAQKETTEVGEQDVNKCSYIDEESKEFSLVVQDNLHLSSSLTRSTYMASSGEERQPATCQAVGVIQEFEVHLSTNNFNELSNSSKMLVDPLSSAFTTLETRTSAADKDDIGFDPLNSNSPGPAMKEKCVGNYVTVINDKEMGSSDDAIIDEAPTSDAKVSSSKNCKSSPTVGNDNCNGIITNFPASDVKIPDGKSAPISDTEKLGITLSRADSTDIAMGDSSLKESALGQAVAEEEEAAAIVSPPTSDCNNDTSVLSSVGKHKHNLGTTDAPQPLYEVPATVSFGSLTKNFPGGKEASTGEEFLLAGECPHDHCQDPTQASKDKIALVLIDQTQDATEANVDVLDSSTKKRPLPTMHVDEVESSSLDLVGSDCVSTFENCGSPTVISCSKCPQGVVECQEGTGGFSESEYAVSEIKSSSDYVKSMNITSKDDSFTFEVQPVADTPQKDTCKDSNPCSEIKNSSDHVKSVDITAKDDSFTFEVQPVVDTPQKGTGKDLNPCSEMPQMSAENSKASQKKSRKGVKHSAISQMSDEGKIKQAFSDTTSQASILKDKEKSQSKQGRGRGRKPSTMSPNTDRNIRNKTPVEVKHCYPESSTMKSSCSPSIPTSGVLDMSTSISPAALPHQPFTDLQQLQLRAQIFVYGSLIQGVPPDEACMMSAFGGADGGRNLWNGAWRAASERCLNQKSPLNHYMTPLHSRSGPFTTEQTSDSKSVHDKNINSNVGRSANKGIPSVELNFSPSLPSPLWSLPNNDGLPSRGHLEFYQSVSPLHPYQPMQASHYTSNTTPWLSQSPLHASWVLPSSGQHSAVPAAEKVQVTPLRDLSTPYSSMLFNSPSSSLAPQTHVKVSAPLVLSAETQKDLTSASSKSESNAQESRKRKKVSTTEEPSVSQSQQEYSATVKTQIPAPPAFGLFSNPPNMILSPSIVSATPQPITSTHFVSEGTSIQVDQSKLQAENASACAAAAVSYSQGIWAQLATQRKSGLLSEVEERLASAAVAAAAAASVAKAAAEAAKIALEAALQAKMMADEAVDSVKVGSTVQISEMSLDVANNLSKFSPVSVMKAKDNPKGGSSVISAAREAARKRVESASAVAKRAENLDAIMKAAELAAEAVSHAGTIIAMGDPLPFSIHELVEAGYEGYWKLHAARGNIGEINDAKMQEKVDDDHVIHTTHLNEQQSNFKEKKKVSDSEGRTMNNEQTMQLEENSEGRQMESALENLPINDIAKDFSSDNVQSSIIKKGSLVEVSDNKESFKGAWFSAWVLEIKDGKAYICYKDLLNEGREQLKVWIPLEHDNDKAPNIRVAHPLTVTKPEGTRKRRRDAVGTYAWEVGDRVDAWMRNGWWEGIVTEKNQEDETKLTVHFPGARGDSTIVRAWNLRPSLIWQDGQWSKWTRAREKQAPSSHEGDSPLEKRQKLGQLVSENVQEIDGRVLENPPRANDMGVPMKLDESRQLTLEARDKIFSVGTAGRKENNAIVKRAGLQKERSRVVIGVPKPGKRRKFMEVSKHYTSEKTDKVHDGSDSIKFTKYLMPQTSNLPRCATRVDNKGKQGMDLNPRGLKSVRSKKLQARNTAEKDNMSGGSESVINSGESRLSSLPNLRTPINEENTLGRNNLLATSVLELPVKPPTSGVLASKHKSSVNEDKNVKGRILPTPRKLTKFEDKGSEDSRKVTSDGSEPRRSNRRIQPTSRLLEGLQSSLIMSKIPSISHDRGIKPSNRSVSSSRGHSHA